MTTRSKSTTTIPSNVPSLPSTSNNKKKEHFPGDPRFGIALSVTQEDVLALREDKMLSTRLLDFLIQQAAPVSSTEEAQPLSQKNGLQRTLEVLAFKPTSGSLI